jgi:hypothetical protein
MLLRAMEALVVAVAATITAQVARRLHLVRMFKRKNDASTHRSPFPPPTSHRPA